MEEFLREAVDMENFGHIVDPTLYRDSERRAASALVTPLFEAALSFLRIHDEQTKRANAALDKVRA